MIRDKLALARGTLCKIKLGVELNENEVETTLSATADDGRDVVFVVTAIERHRSRGHHLVGVFTTRLAADIAVEASKDEEPQAYHYFIAECDVE